MNVVPGSPTLKPSAFELLRRGLQARDLRSNAAYVLGRFHGVRRVYAAALRAQAQLRPAADSGLQPYPGPSLFDALQPAQLVSELREHSLCLGLQLPAETVRELVAYARSAECQPRLGGARFRYDDVVQGVLPTGEPAVRASAAIRCCSRWHDATWVTRRVASTAGCTGASSARVAMATAASKAKQSTITSTCTATISCTSAST
jgi:hypothetical protein